MHQTITLTVCLLIAGIGHAAVIRQLVGPEGSGLRIAVLPDIDADQHNEVLLSALRPGQDGVVSVFSGRTGETLSTLRNAAIGFSLVATGDLDRDGCADFASGNPDAGVGGSVTWYSGCTRVSFRHFSGTLAIGVGRSLANVGDVDGDGLSETLVGSNRCAFLINGAGGVRHEICPGIAGFGDPVGVVADQNGDQIPDLAIGNQSDGTVQIFASNTAQPLTVWAGIPASSGTKLSNIEDAGDVNADGIRDLLVASQGSLTTRTGGMVRLLSGRNGEELRLYAVDPFNMFAMGAATAAGDLDRDGHADTAHMVVQRTLFGSATTLLVKSGRTAQTIEELALPNQGLDASSLAASGDLNGDRRPDWLVGAERTNVGFVLSGNQPAQAPFEISRTLTGAWHDANSPGQGMMLEILSEHRIFLHWFGYDASGNQQWFGGVGTWDGDTATVEVFTYRNGRFPPHNDPSQIERRRWGTLVIKFNSCASAEMQFDASADLGFGRGRVTLSRITAPDGLRCQD